MMILATGCEFRNAKTQKPRLGRGLRGSVSGHQALRGDPPDPAAGSPLDDGGPMFDGDRVTAPHLLGSLVGDPSVGREVGQRLPL